MPFEVMDGALVFLSGGSRLECAEIPSLSRLRIFLARIEPITTGLKFPDHTVCPPIISGAVLQDSRIAHLESWHGW